MVFTLGRTIKGLSDLVLGFESGLGSRLGLGRFRYRLWVYGCRPVLWIGRIWKTEVASKGTNILTCVKHTVSTHQHK